MSPYANMTPIRNVHVWSIVDAEAQQCLSLLVWCGHDVCLQTTKGVEYGCISR